MELDMPWSLFILYQFAGSTELLRRINSVNREVTESINER